MGKRCVYFVRVPLVYLFSLSSREALGVHVRAAHRASAAMRAALIWKIVHYICQVFTWSVLACAASAFQENPCLIFGSPLS